MSHFSFGFTNTNEIYTFDPPVFPFPNASLLTLCKCKKSEQTDMLSMYTFVHNAKLV